ncbi:MAG: triple tyrosine motif-containing protein [Vicinamibacterales bacterium]|nr:triple tyrosine motif-containing protein [Vicinamibacterales bacterium]
MAPQPRATLTRWSGLSGVTALLALALLLWTSLPVYAQRVPNVLVRHVSVEDGLSGDPIRLSYQDSVIGFEFAALDFTAPDQNRYRYRLEGFESEWNEVGDVRRATYTNLEAGGYTLRVQGSNNDGVWNEEGLSLALVVGSPPWLAWWAIVLYMVIGIGALVALVRTQKRKVEHQADYSHRLEREVAARTDELASQNRELAGLNTRLQEVSVTDSLTGLWNRRYLANEIPKDLARIRRARINHHDAAPDDPRQMDTTLLFLMLDLDGLKGVNDTYGHQAGDRVDRQDQGASDAGVPRNGHAHSLGRRRISPGGTTDGYDHRRRPG